MDELVPERARSYARPSAGLGDALLTLISQRPEEAAVGHSMARRTRRTFRGASLFVTASVSRCHFSYISRDNIESVVHPESGHRCPTLARCPAFGTPDDVALRDRRTFHAARCAARFVPPVMRAEQNLRMVSYDLSRDQYDEALLEVLLVGQPNRKGLRRSPGRAAPWPDRS